MTSAVTIAVFTNPGLSPSSFRRLPAGVDVVVVPAAFVSVIDRWRRPRPGLELASLEDFRRPASVQTTAQLLEGVSRAELPVGGRLSQLVRYADFEVWWLTQKQVYSQYLTPYVEYARLWQRLAAADLVLFGDVSPLTRLAELVLTVNGIPHRYLDRLVRIKTGLQRLNLRSLLLSFVQIIVSLASLTVLVLRRPRLAIWAGDRITPPLDCDFRYEDLYRSLRQARLGFVEFLRSYTTPREFVRNLLRRRRPVVYPESFLRPFFPLFQAWAASRLRRLTRQISGQLNNATAEDRLLTLVAVQVLADCLILRAQIPVSRCLLWLTGLKVLFVPGGYSRVGPLVMAAKCQGVATVGLMHGPYVRQYHPDEVGLGFDGPRSHAIDLFGVWSEYWKNYYRHDGRFFRDEQLFVAGHLREFPAVRSPASLTSHQPLRVLLLSEPLVESAEILPYLKTILGDRRFQLAIKCRPDRNDPILRALAARGVELPLAHGRMEPALAHTDVVIGSHSTALLEALYFYKPILVLRTERWGDYFSLAPVAPQVLVDRPGALPVALTTAVQQGLGPVTALRSRFWGSLSFSGPQTIVAVIRDYLRSGQLRPAPPVLSSAAQPRGND